MNAFIFVSGALVTVIAFGAVGGIWWAAFHDGQTDDAIKHGEQTGLDESAPLRPRDHAPEAIRGFAWQAAVPAAPGAAAAGSAQSVSSPDARPLS